MAEQATDLSKLTDEQLSVYRDLLAKKQQPAKPAEKPITAPQQPQTFGHGISEFGSQINPLSMITGAYNTIRHPLDTARNIYDAQAHELGQVPGLVRQGRYSEAVGHGTAGVLPLIGPAAAKIGETIGGTEPQFDKYGKIVRSGEAPDPAGGVGAGLGLITSILAAPKVSEYTGRALKGTAGSLVKSALNLPGKAEAYGANPAGAVLEETRGIRPSTIARSGQQKITDLSGQLDTLADNATEMPSLTPARKVLSRASGSAAAANSEQGPREIGRMSDQLTKVRPGFKGITEYPMPPDSGLPAAAGPYSPVSFRPTTATTPMPPMTVPGPPRLSRGITTPAPAVAANQPARTFLGMKRQFDNDFISNWNPSSNTKHGLGVARQAYGAMADELNRTVPGAEGLNGRIQSLIPAVDRAEAVSHNAGTMQRAMDRIARPTGGLVPALIGKQIGGIPGLLAGLGVPEMISAPFAKMAVARGAYGTGKVLTSPLARRASQALPILRQNQ